MQSAYHDLSLEGGYFILWASMPNFVLGNECERVLSAVAEGKLVLPENLTPFVHFILAFKGVVDATMRTSLGERWQEDLEYFRTLPDVMVTDFDCGQSSFCFCFYFLLSIHTFNLRICYLSLQLLISLPMMDNHELSAIAICAFANQAINF